MSVERLDRRDFLERAGQIALAAGLLRVPAAWSAATPDPELRALARSLDGTVVPRGTAAYAKAYPLFDTRFDAIKPRAIVFAETVRDVQSVIAWANRYGVRIVGRAGGHSYGGYSTASGAVVVDVTRMSRVAANPSKRTAVIGAGTRLIDVYAKLWEHGMTVPAGSCPTVGIGGLALGGGVGFSSRRLGLTCDNILGLTLVTAAGKVLVCNRSQHADLYWACRGGGGGNFGIVTSFAFRTHPVANVTTYRIDWPSADAVAAVDAWQRWAPHAPDALFSVFTLARGRVSSSGQFFGTEQQLRALLAPLASAGSPTRVAVTTRTYM